MFLKNCFWKSLNVPHSHFNHRQLNQRAQTTHEKFCGLWTIVKSTDYSVTGCHLSFYKVISPKKYYAMDRFIQFHLMYSELRFPICLIRWIYYDFYTNLFILEITKLGVRIVNFNDIDTDTTDWHSIDNNVGLWFIDNCASTVIGDWQNVLESRNPTNFYLVQISKNVFNSYHPWNLCSLNNKSSNLIILFSSQCQGLVRQNLR